MEQGRIKFKGKCAADSKYAGEWVEGGLVQCEDGTCLIIRGISDGCTFTYHVDPSTVCQFTGLTDKNGQDVYDGDILRFIAKNKKQYIRYVEYKSGGFLLIDEKSGLGSEIRSHQSNGSMAWEVIGNKFDTKEG